jgi:transcriptional regulator with XRE-family HTH domain
MDPLEPDESDRLGAFGQWLARERELRGLSRDEVTRATRLAPGTVEALESGEEGRMPPRAYAVGYLRAYAAAVGLDADDVVLRYEEAVGATQAPGGAPAVGRRTGLALIVAAAAAAAAAAWALLSR